MTTDGILLIDKLVGPSSAQSISIVKKTLGSIEKIGHAGTLDPFASGLLVVLLGKATRLADYFQAGTKTYSGEIQFGVTTESDDITGAVLSKSNEFPDFATAQKLALSLVGSLDQIPPRVSALKVGGKRAYDLVRKGQDFEIAARNVTLFSIELKELTEDTVFFRISCSKGFYVRALARDLGQMLGCGACLKSLRREQSLPFKVEQAVSADKVKIADILAWDSAMKLLGNQELEVQDQEFNALKNGLVPYSLQRRVLPDLDSNANALLVYRRKSDGVAGGLLSAKNSELKITVNM